MRILVTALCFTALTIISVGGAQATDQNINISTTVNSFCRVQGFLTALGRYAEVVNHAELTAV